MTDAEFEDWLFDTSRNTRRLMLIDLEHASGTVRLGSLPWMSEAREAYDDWLIRFPEIEDSLDNFLGVGDIDALNLDPTTDWLALSFRGQLCRWYFGDVDWPKSAFRPVATTLIAGCRNLTENRFRFDLMDAGQQLARTFASSSSTETRTVSGAIDYVMAQAGLPPVTYQNIPATKLAYQVQFDVSDTSRVDATVREIARSVGAHVRVTQTGDVEVFIPPLFTEPAIALTEDVIGYDGLEMADVVPAYRRVEIVLADGSVVSAPTNADTGFLNETMRIETPLTSSSDATVVLNEKVAYHAIPHAEWRLQVFDKGQLIQVGDPVYITHERLTAIGVVSQMNRSPLANFTTIEVRV